MARRERPFWLHIVRAKCSGFMLYNAKSNGSNWAVCPLEERHRANMGTYIYGIVISVVMIAAGFSGQFSGSGSGINLPLVAMGTLFLVIDVAMLLKARQAGQQAPQADNPKPTNAEVKQAEAAAEPQAFEEQYEEAVEVGKDVAQADAETAEEASVEVAAETATGATAGVAEVVEAQAFVSEQR